MVLAGAEIRYTGTDKGLPIKKGSIGLVQRVMFKNAVGALFTTTEGKRIIAYLKPEEYLTEDEMRIGRKICLRIKSLLKC